MCIRYLYQIARADPRPAAWPYRSIAKRTTCAGPLDEHAVELEVATVKEALALLQAGPSAEMPPRDPTEAEPGSESADFQMAAEDGVFATSAQRADGFLNGMAAQEAPPRAARTE